LKAPLSASAEGLFLLLNQFGHFRQGIELAEMSLEYMQTHPENLERQLKVQLLMRLGEFSYHIGEYERGEPALKAALEILDTQEAPAQKALALLLLANLHIVRGQYEGALELLRQGMALAETLAQPGLDFTLRNRAGVVAYFQKDYPLASQYFEAALQAARQSGEPAQAAVCLNNLGDVALELHDYPRARVLLLESLSLCTPSAMTTLRGEVLNSLGSLETQSGDAAQAAGYFVQALQVVQEIDAQPLALSILLYIAGLWQRQGKGALAAALADVIARHPAAQHDIRQRAARLLEELPPPQSSSAWQPEHLRRVMADAMEMLQSPHPT